MAARIATAPSDDAGTEASAPWKLPMGVRAAPMMTTLRGWGMSTEPVRLLFERAGCYQTAVKLSIRRRQFAFLFGVLCAAFAACDAPVDVENASGFVVAPLANDGCDGAPQRGLPPAVDTVVVELSDASGAVYSRRRYTRGEDGALTVGGLRVEGVAADGGQRVAIYACEGATATYVARAEAPTVAEFEKHGLSLQLLPVGAISCTGTGRGSAYDRYAGLGRARGLAAVIDGASGGAYILAGAARADDLVFSAEPGDIDYDFFSTEESLFLPSRLRALRDRSADPAARIGARAWPTYRSDGELDGALIIGGAPRIAWSPGPLGPLAAVNGQLASPYAMWFEVDGEQYASVANGEIVPRFLPGAAATPEAAVLAGGITYPPDCAAPCQGEASAVLEAWHRGVLARFALDQPRVGATVTAVAPGRFLIWGGDLGDDGATPAVVYDAGADAPIVATIAADEGLVWHATAYHAAAPLPAGRSGGRALIVGGVGFLRGAVENNPELGGPDGPANAFVVELSADGGRAMLHPVQVETEARPALKRALLSAAAHDGTVAISGGWRGVLPTPAQLEVAADLVFYEDATPAGTVRRVNGPDGVALSLSRPRLGHAVIRLDEGGLVFAGGFARGQVLSAAERYTPPIAESVCTADEIGR